MQDGPVGDLPRGHRGELSGEAGQVIGLLEHVEEVQGGRAALHLGLEGDEVGWFGQLVELRDRDPRLSPTGCDPHPAGGVGGQGTVQAVVGFAEAALQVGDEHRRVERLSDGAVMNLPVRLEVHQQVVFGFSPAIGADDVDLPAAVNRSSKAALAVPRIRSMRPGVGGSTRSTRQRDNSASRSRSSDSSTGQTSSASQTASLSSSPTVAPRNPRDLSAPK